MGAWPVHAQEMDQQFMAVFVQGKRVGYFKNLRRVFADSVVTTELMTFSVDAGEGTVDKLSVDEVVETPEGQLLHFRHERVRGPILVRIAGTLNGPKLQVSLVREGQKQEHELDWPEGARMAEARRLLAKEQGLTEGTQYTFMQFFSDGLVAGEVMVSIGGEEEVEVLGTKMKLTKTTEVISLQDKTLEYTVYRDASARAMKIIAPTMFMELVNCSEAYAMTPLGGIE